MAFPKEIYCRLLVAKKLFENFERPFTDPKPGPKRTIHIQHLAQKGTIMIDSTMRDQEPGVTYSDCMCRIRVDLFGLKDSHSVLAVGREAAPSMPQARKIK